MIVSLSRMTAVAISRGFPHCSEGMKNWCLTVVTSLSQDISPSQCLLCFLNPCSYLSRPTHYTWVFQDLKLIFNLAAVKPVSYQLPIKNSSSPYFTADEQSGDGICGEIGLFAAKPSYSWRSLLWHTYCSLNTWSFMTISLPVLQCV